MGIDVVSKTSTENFFMLFVAGARGMRLWGLSMRLVEGEEWKQRGNNKKVSRFDLYSLFFLTFE